MFRIMTADEAISLIRDGDCICVNSFVGIENPVELHEALYRRYQQTHSPKHLTIVSSAGVDSGRCASASAVSTASAWSCRGIDKVAK